MTTSANGRKITSATDGVTTAFSCPQLTAPDALQVYLLDAADDANDDGELLTAGEDYELTGDYRAGTAQIVFSVAPDAGQYVRRFRQTSRAQDADYVANDGFPADVHELQLDRLSHIDEELDDDLASAAAANALAVTVPPEDETSIVLPVREDRQNKYLAFDADGNPRAASPSEDASTPVITIAFTQLDPGQDGSFSITGTWPNITWHIALPKGAPGTPGALSNGTYGDIVVTDDGDTMTVGARSVSFAKAQAIATARILGRTSASSGDIEELSYAAVKAALGLDNVTNTSDANKPVSTAQQSALDAKQNIAPSVGDQNAPASPLAIVGTNDMTTIRGLNAALVLSAPSGSPSQGFGHVIRIKDNGVSRALTWNAAFRALSGVTLPTATTAGKTHYIYMIYNSTDTKWDVVACKVEG